MNEHFAEAVLQSQHDCPKTALVDLERRMKRRNKRKGTIIPFQLLLPPHFLHQERDLHYIKLIVQLLNLLQILPLHAPPRIALLALVALLGEQQLIDDNGVGVDVIRGQLLDHALGLVQRQELGDADAHEGGHIGVLELGVHLANGFAQGLHLLQDLVQALTAREATARADDPVEHGAKLRRELREFRQRFLQHGGELEEAQCVAGRRGVEDDGFVGEGFHLLEHFREGHGFVHTGDLGG